MEQQKSSIGGIIGTIIILALIILGGLYFWGKRVEESRNTQDVTGEISQKSSVNETDENGVSSNDDLTTIEAELNATTFENMDAEAY